MANLNLPINTRSESRPDLDAFSHMDERLIEYGECFLRGGKGITFQIYRDDRPEQKPVVFSGRQLDEARLLHRAVISLELRLSLIIQVFYGETVAKRWHKLRPETQEEIVDDLTNWTSYPFGVNKRLERAAKEARVAPVRIRPDEFIALRDDAIRQLIRLERASASVYRLPFPCG